MNEFPRQKLAEILTQYTPSIANDPKRLEGLLAYVTDNQYPLETNLLIGALREGVAGELINAPQSIPLSTLLPPLVGRLRDRMGLTPEAAEWAVRAWAEALGHTSEPKLEIEPFEPPKIDLQKEATTVWWYVKQFPIYFLRQTRLSWRLMFDARVSVLLKLIPIIAVAYIISPIGLIVNIIPLAGTLANIAVYMLALALFNYLAPAEVVREHMARIEQNDINRQTKIHVDEKQSDKDKHITPR